MLVKMQSMPSQRVVLAEFFTTEDLTLLFIVRADFNEPQVVEIPGSLDALRSYVRANFGAGPAGSRVRDLDLAEWQARLASFVEPILPWVAEGDILWLVPHDVLHYLPLHALQVDGRYLAERNPICYSPSASVLSYCHAKRKPARGGGALVLGDSRPDVPLPFAREEARRVAQLLGCEPLLGSAASRAKVVEALADEASRQAVDVLHVACHGYFDAAEALKSGLLLAPEGDDGTLTAEQIFGLQLRAELVTLSACESGVNERRPGDELIGLTRALIYAGTSSVLVSLWRVDDLATALS
jgi:CHAT domain-containing protein